MPDRGISFCVGVIWDSDLILLIRDGRIAEQGTHEQFMERNGAYAQMYRMQMGE